MVSELVGIMLISPRIGVVVLQVTMGCIHWVSIVCGVAMYCMCGHSVHSLQPGYADGLGRLRQPGVQKTSLVCAVVCVLQMVGVTWS
jgi:hypothetical protein